MGKMWVNGNSYEPNECGHLEFFGPITPDDYDHLREQVRRLREALESITECENKPCGMCQRIAEHALNESESTQERE
jgi:hypothetical protein